MSVGCPIASNDWPFDIFLRVRTAFEIEPKSFRFICLKQCNHPRKHSIPSLRPSEPCSDRPQQTLSTRWRAWRAPSASAAAQSGMAPRRPVLNCTPSHPVHISDTQLSPRGPYCALHLCLQPFSLPLLTVSYPLIPSLLRPLHLTAAQFESSLLRKDSLYPPRPFPNLAQVPAFGSVFC